MSSSTPVVGTSFFGLDLRKLSNRLQGMRRQVSKRVLLLEFETASLRLAEARFSGGGLQVDHVTRFDLPDEALERGVPTDPKMMGGLIKQLCREKQIAVHRCAVVLPTESAFQRLIHLPLGLIDDEARDYLHDPDNGIQIPIALGQADFDLQPTILPVLQTEGKQLQTYLLTAIPSNLVDRIVETLQFAQLELQNLEIGGYSQLRLMTIDLLALNQQDVWLVLELTTECTYFILVSASGPLFFERLAAIRDFPDPILTEEQAISTLEEGVMAEQISINQENYIAIGELDLRLLLSEIRDALTRFSTDWSGFRLTKIALTGRNSAHPFLPELLQDEFDCPVQAVEPMLITGIAGLQFDSVLVQKSLNRLIGLGLGLLPSEYLLSCELPANLQHKSLSRSIPLVDVVSDPAPATEEPTLSVDPSVADDQAGLSPLDPQTGLDQQALVNQISVDTESVGQKVKLQPAVVVVDNDESPLELSEPVVNPNEQLAKTDYSVGPSEDLLQLDSTEDFQSTWPTINSHSTDPNDSSTPAEAIVDQRQSNQELEENLQVVENSILIDLNDTQLFEVEPSNTPSEESDDHRLSSGSNVDSPWPSIAVAGSIQNHSDDDLTPDIPIEPFLKEGRKNGLSHETVQAGEDTLLGELKFSSDD